MNGVADALTVDKEVWTGITKDGTLQDLKALSEDKNQAYSFLCRVLLPCSVGKSKWTQDCTTKKVSEMSTIVDEGFCILVLRNYWNRWWTMVETGRKKADEVPSVWTNDGCGAGASTNGGWSKEGREELGKINQLVTNDRESETTKLQREKFENGILNYYSCRNKEKKNKKRKEREVEMLEFEDHMDDLGKLATSKDAQVLLGGVLRNASLLGITVAVSEGGMVTANDDASESTGPSVEV